MPLFGFKRRFVEPILAGTKDQTIRAVRKVPVRLHQVMHLYTGLRRPGAKLIARVLCIEILDIYLIPQVENGLVSYSNLDGSGGFATNEPGWLDHFARRDGFASWEDLCAFWREEHGKDIETFTGQVYRWDPRDIPR